MTNGFIHTELHTGDVKAAKKFYKDIFDWKLADQEMGPGMTYTMIDTGERMRGGGMMAKPMAEAPTQWLPYVSVESVKRTVAKAEKRGAKIIVPYNEVPNMGAFAIFLDPTGAAIGVWETAPKAAKKAAKKKK